MKIKLYSTDIECESCSIVIDKLFKTMDGVISHETKPGELIIEFDENKITKESIVNAITQKGYKVSEEQPLGFKKSFNNFLKEKHIFSSEHKLLKILTATFFILLIVQGAFLYFLQDWKYGIWLFYAVISIVSIVGTLSHFKLYKTTYTCMIGMMIGMTVGMQTGLLLGSIIGAINGFFIGALSGMLVASIIGAWAGSCCGIMGVLEGMMAGLMGGTMGPMITVMMFNDNVQYFMPFYLVLNLLILAGLSYMILTHAAPINSNVTKKTPSFYIIFGASFLLLALINLILFLAPQSIFFQ
jgi:copper chaperone CopZ